MIQADSAYHFYTPETPRVLTVGPDGAEVTLAFIPWPIHVADLKEDRPSDQAIGLGVYDYLRKYPDCPHNRSYAELLRDAFPHYLADLAAQVVMIDHRKVDAAYKRRMVTGMKILAVLDPSNSGLAYRLGVAYYELGTMFSEMASSRHHFLSAMAYFKKALSLGHSDLSLYSYLAQLEFFIGDYVASLGCYRQLLAGVEDARTREVLAQRIQRLEADGAPDHPLVDDMETVGEALRLYAEKDYEGARANMEAVEEQGDLFQEFACGEFYHFLGLCRERCGDASGAFAAFDQAVELDPELQEALEGKERIMDGGGRS